MCKKAGVSPPNAEATRKLCNCNAQAKSFAGLKASTKKLRPPLKASPNKTTHTFFNVCVVLFFIRCLSRKEPGVENKNSTLFHLGHRGRLMKLFSDPIPIVLRTLPTGRAVKIFNNLIKKSNKDNLCSDFNIKPRLLPA